MADLFSASVLGKIPNIVIVTVAGASFTSNKLLSFGIYGMYMLVLMAVIYKKFPGLLKQRKMKRVPPLFRRYGSSHSENFSVTF